MLQVNDDSSLLFPRGKESEINVQTRVLLLHIEDIYQTNILFGKERNASYLNTTQLNI